MLKLIVVALVVWWVFLRKANASTGVFQGEGPDFDPVTAGQMSVGPRGAVTVGDDWSASFMTGNGNWADEYRSHATTEQWDGIFR